jgi:hypothetical protein
LRELFAYDPATGRLIVKIGSSRVKAGQEVSDYAVNGYLRCSFDGFRVYAHRLVWAYHYGTWPDGQIDHIDGNRRNNAISNLRDATHTINAQNERNPRRNNNLGVLGVHYEVSRKKFKAQISIGHKCLCLGRFDTAEQAQSAYVKAKRAYHDGCTL